MAKTELHRTVPHQRALHNIQYVLLLLDEFFLIEMHIQIRLSSVQLSQLNSVSICFVLIQSSSLWSFPFLVSALLILPILFQFDLVLSFFGLSTSSI